MESCGPQMPLKWSGPPKSTLVSGSSWTRNTASGSPPLDLPMTRKTSSSGNGLAHAYFSGNIRARETTVRIFRRRESPLENSQRRAPLEKIVSAIIFQMRFSPTENSHRRLAGSENTFPDQKSFQSSCSPERLREPADLPTREPPPPPLSAPGAQAPS